MPVYDLASFPRLSSPLDGGVCAEIAGLSASEYCGCKPSPRCANATNTKPVVALRSAIPRLLAASSPAAVFRRIAAVIINSVDACVLWPFSHVGEKSFKGIAPSIANGNAPAAIVAKRGMRIVIAPGFHRYPRAPFAARFHAVPPALKATAAFRVTVLEACRKNYRPASASTRAVPACLAPLFPSIGLNSKISKGLASKIFGSGGQCYHGVSHLDASMRQSDRGLAHGRASTSHYNTSGVPA